mgnify:CR=1 FL=1
MGQNGKGTGVGVANSSSADVAPPAKRQDLTHAGTGRERAKPVGLRRSENRPRPVERAESEPQGTLKGLRVTCTCAASASERMVEEAKAVW